LEAPECRRAVLVGPTLHAVSAYGFSGALGFKVFRHSGRTRGCKQQHVLPPVLRRHCRVSPQRRVPELLCLTWLSSAYARGRHPNRNRGRLRIRLSRHHPRVGLDNSGNAMQASLQGEARGTGSFNTFRSQDGSVLGLGPFVFSPFGDGRSSGQHRTSSLGLASQLWVTRASEASRRLHGGAEPKPSGAFCYGCLTGCLPQAAGNGKGDRSQR
jgi:hypothetical protein